MIVNILRFRFRDGTTDEQRTQVLTLMSRTANVDSVSFSTVGRDLGDPAEGYTHAYCVGVADLPALRRYLYDPVHLSGDFDILPHLAGLSSVRLSDEPDPELGQKILALHLEKVSTYPEWAQLLDSIPDGAVPTS